MTSDLAAGERYAEVTAYERWIRKEGIPVVKGYYVEDLTKLPLEPWERKGGLGAFINLEGHAYQNDAYVCEIPPGESLKPQKHLYEELILILSGNGATTVWNEGGKKHTFEWREWSLFAIPLNVWHQHFNAQGNKPVRYMAATTAPYVINFFHNDDFVFNNPFVFSDRYSGEQDYFSRGGMVPINQPVWESNYIDDVSRFKLVKWEGRGAGGSKMLFELADNALVAHIAEFPVGSYKKAHRHSAGANVIVLAGSGYSLMWPEGQPRIKIDWRPGTLFVPPDMWFHQHFNTGSEPARYLALRWQSMKNPVGKPYGEEESVKTGGNQIEYEEEDPEIRRQYEAELARRVSRKREPNINEEQ